MTRLGNKIPVEPLDPLRVQRVERNVLAAFEGVDFAPRRPAAWWRWGRFAIPALAVAGVGLAIYLNVRSTTVPIAAPVAIPATPRISHIRTGAHGAADELTVGRAKLVFSPRTEADIEERSDGATLIRLTRGAVRCEVEPRNHRAPFVVAAGEVKVTVVGTVFTVERDHRDRVRVAVERGKVQVARGDELTLLAAGQTWRGTAAELAARAAGGPQIDGTAGQQLGRGDTGDRLALAERSSHVPKAAHGRKTAPPKNARKNRRASKQPLDPRAGLRRARSLAPPLALSVPDASGAIEQYRKKLSGNNARAEYAMYSIAYVQYRKLGDRAAALRTTGFYRRRFPSGKHSRDVAWLRMLVLCDRGPNRDCRAAAHDYRRRFHSNDRELEIVQELINW